MCVHTHGHTHTHLAFGVITDDKRERGEEAGVEVPRGRGIGARVRHEEQDYHCKYCHEDEADLAVV